MPAASPRRPDLSVALECTSDAVFILDEAWRCTYANAAAAALFGHTLGAMLGADFHSLLGCGLQEEDGSCAIQAAVAAGRDLHSARGVMRHREGQWLPVATSVAPFVVDGASAGAVLVVRDASQQVQLEHELSQRVVLDALTGLPNRVLLMDRLELAIRRIGTTSPMIAVLFVDIDNFKVVNDSLGHDRGDELLLAIADRFRLNTRDSDTVARFGGDEFVIVMEQVEDIRQVVELAHRISRAMVPPVEIDGRDIISSVSIGIAIATDSTATPQSLLRDADAAMYRAKERGRNRFELFDDGMRFRANERLELEGELRQAIDDGQLRVRYQPIVSMGDQQVVGFEALARWQHPTRGLLGPADFIHLAEETGLIGRVGEIVLDEALRQCGEWLAELRRQGRGRQLTMAVNLSASQVTDDSLPDIVAGALAQHGVPATALCLEITESVPMGDSDRARIALEHLRGLGIRIALDDFGTGYSSLLYLREFPVDILKLDRFFVAGLGHSRADRAIAASIVSLAHALDMIAVGEGVETTEQRAALLEFGCDLGQGFLWDRPLHATDAAATLGLIPVRAQTEPTTPPAEVSAHPGSALSVVEPFRIVVVDDNIAERGLLAHVLEDLPEFIVVGEAGSGDEGVAVAERTQPDLLLLDLSMPGVDGVQALPHILRVAPDTRVVIFSGFISEGVTKMVIASGAVGCLDKNTGLDRLPSELLKLLSHSTPTSRSGAPRAARRRGDGSGLLAGAS